MLALGRRPPGKQVGGDTDVVELDLALAKEPEDTIQVSGTPTVAGTFTFTIYVWCYGTNVSGQTATQGYTLVVK